MPYFFSSSQCGAIVGEPKTSPGLYAKVPLIQDIQRIDRRLLDYEAEEFEIIAGDQKRLVVDAYARYRVVAAKTFAQTVPGGEQTLRNLAAYVTELTRNDTGGIEIASKGAEG